jgi:hypothetical protein
MALQPMIAPASELVMAPKPRKLLPKRGVVPRKKTPVVTRSRIAVSKTTKVVNAEPETPKSRKGKCSCTLVLLMLC